MLYRNPTGKFIKDVEKAKKRKLNIEKMESIITLLCENKEPPKQCRVHMLSGNYKGYWECHIESDWLLIYKITDDAIELARTGTHSDLFR